MKSNRCHVAQTVCCVCQRIISAAERIAQPSDCHATAVKQWLLRSVCVGLRTDYLNTLKNQLCDCDTTLFPLQTGRQMTVENWRRSVVL